MKEIEVLVELYTKISDCKKKLSKYEFVGEKHTIDVYYYDPLRNNLKPDANNQINECLRLRTKGKQYFITYKVDHFDNKAKWLYSDEYETEVSDLQQVQKIIELLGLKKLIVIDSKKTIYKTDIYEIALEEVEGLGNFMEVEFCTKDDVDVVRVKEEITKFIQDLNVIVSAELNIGKPEMMIKKWAE